MNERYSFLRKYSATARAWCVNMSVASFAVGIYQVDISGVLLGLITLGFAFGIDYVVSEE